MLECSPRCPTVRRQIRDQIKRAGWTDEYVRSIVNVHSVDSAQDLKRGLGRKVKPDSREKPLVHRKKDRQELAIDHDDRYKKKRRRERFDPSSQKLERVIDYEESIDDSDATEDEFEEPVASLVQESIYYTEKKQIARVAPLRRVTPKVSPQSARGTPTRTRTPKTKSREIGSPIEDDEIIVYGKGEVEDTLAYRKDIAYREKPGPSKIVDDKRTVKRRDDSPDSYYQYTPKELASDWPHDDCDETCPARVLRERAEKLQEKPRRIDDRYSPISQGYFADMCTCSLSCMIHNLRKDPFVRNIVTSAMLFAIGIKLCSELHGWYLPISA